MRLLISALMVVLFNGEVLSQKPRLIVTTDIGQDPDDEQSMVRLLHFANEFRLEGLIANADNNSDKEAPVLKAHLIHNMIDSYSLIAGNLKVHDPAYPKAEYLHSIVKKGTFGNRVNVPLNQFVGQGKDTEGSDWIIHVVDKQDSAPLHVSVWGGACDLAQVLWKVKQTRSADQTNAFVKKLRVFFIGKQDASNQWIIDNFPDMWIILALDRSGDKWESGYRGMFWGGDMSLTSKEWLHTNIIGQNPLASQYPDQAYTGGNERNPFMAMKEGDSPALLYFMENGLNQPEHPEWGGWGGRYTLERNQFYRDDSDSYFDEQAGKIITSPRATVFRWRPDFQNDFVARVQWGTKGYSDANHHPIVEINGDRNKAPLVSDARTGVLIELDAGESTDPDNDHLVFDWFVYTEAGTYNGDVPIDKTSSSRASLIIPQDANDKSIQVICRVSDTGSPSMTSYKRCIIQVYEK
ncbi:MAG: DUF1593 domain-containing protein [Saprospiraceae bacterium]|nr:DUF1593 domain-containing protein [Saprospiraceae bacterium]MBP7802466.1 DUF1593 domain-containing protein [Saprospiraceae bacterium]MBP8096219.1 DUF1593 domain-containing protein [Saprospiraceae bacterium]